ncbi:hypothetical protein CH370_15345 [Leptospira kmetyi]|nr:hypothetical protein CH370_15345 [Leptospira kmetyi]
MIRTTFCSDKDFFFVDKSVRIGEVFFVLNKMLEEGPLVDRKHRFEFSYKKDFDRSGHGKK